MKYDLQNMLKKVLFFDAVIGIVLTFVVYNISPIWPIYFLLGLFMAYISLFCNAFITNASLTSGRTSKKLLILLGSIVRVLLVCAIGIIIYTYNVTNMIVYIVGYSIQFISIVLYGTTIKD